MKLTIAFILFIISISLFSFDTLLQYSSPINISQDISYPIYKQDISDFSKIPKNLNTYQSKYEALTDKEDIIPFAPINNKWYFDDFSEDPFDGQLEIYNFGAPLPSVNLSLFIASLISIFFLQYNKKRILKSIPEKIS